MSNAFDKLKQRAAKVTKNAPDMRVAQTGGGYEPPAAGTARMRFVGYVELGTQPDTFQGRPKDAKKVRLVFELSGKKHPPREAQDGTLYPQRMTVNLTQSNHEKATLFKLFARMNPERTYSHIAQMLGDAFLGKVYHDTFKTESGADRTIARLRPKGGEYHIDPPFIEDVETGEVKEVVVDEPMSEPQIFFWETPTLEDWDNLYIDGEYEDGRSKNVLQETLRRAVDWVDSPMYKLLEEDGRDPDSYAPLDPPAYVKAARGDDEDDEAEAPVSKAVSKPAKKVAKPDKKTEVEEDDEVVAQVDDDDVGPITKQTKKPVAKVEDDEDLDDDDSVPAAVAGLLDDLD